MEKSYLTLDKIRVYNISFESSNKVWSIVLKWDYLQKVQLGNKWSGLPIQFRQTLQKVLSGNRRKIRFYRISIGSLEETGDCIRKS